MKREYFRNRRISPVEDSKDDKWRLRAESGNEDTNNFSIPDNVDGVTADTSRGIFTIGAFEIF